MAEIPWWAWIAIVALVMGGLITITHTLARRPRVDDTSAADREEIARLKRRIEDLEYRLNRGDFPRS